MDILQGHELTWSKLLDKLSAKFYPFIVQQKKEKEFMKLKISDNMLVLQYASKSIELSKFVPGMVASERMKMKRFRKG